MWTALCVLFPSLRTTKANDKSRRAEEHGGLQFPANDHGLALEAALNIADNASNRVIKTPITVTYLKPYRTGQADMTVVTIRQTNSALRDLAALVPSIITITVKIVIATVSTAVIRGEKCA